MLRGLAENMATKTDDRGTPVFPYTTEPKALRRLLAEIPKRPKPPKLDMAKLRAWDVSGNNNARTAINVLKKIGLVKEGGVPTDNYIEFMKTGTGPGVLASRLREVYRPLFEAAHAPQAESDDELKKLFHIHTGGGDDAMRLQIQTFKALADHANFTDVAADDGTAVAGAAASSSSRGSGGSLPPVQIDLHIHLPENKTTRDYEAIIQDIAKYIYGRQIDRN
jgi:Family of unknown function (DUF5343)